MAGNNAEQTKRDDDGHAVAICLEPAINRVAAVATDHSLSDMLAFFTGSLLVQDIAEPLETCDAADDAQSIAASLRDKHFDVIGVEEGCEVVGYAEVKKLGAGTVGEWRQLFNVRDIVGKRTPLMELLPMMVVRERFFVLDRVGVTHIVALGDLHKPPVRLLLFGHTSALEMAMLRLVRSCYPNESFCEKLSAARVEKVKALFLQREQRNEHIDLADCLQLADKRELLRRVPGLSKFFAFDSNKAFVEFLKEAEGLRDRLAHAQDVANGTTWSEIIEVVNKIGCFVRAYQGVAGEISGRFGTRP